MRLHQLVADAAAVTPDRRAVAGPDGELTYGQLGARANAVAHRLRLAGVGPGDRVLIWSDKSCASVAGMQAVLCVGGAYVPADGNAPVSRVAAMARDCDARAVLTTDTRLPLITTELGPETRCLDLSAPADGPAQPIFEATDPDDLAYILYTSGSTGTPKGVCVSHRGARAFVDWAVALLAARPGDRFANHAAHTFDLSVLDLYAAFSVGASVHLIPAELAYAPVQLTEFLYEEQITVWYSVPSALILMMRYGELLGRPAPPALRAVLFAGEPFPVGQVRKLADWTDARLLNLYGPTETNVCTYHETLPADLTRDLPVPIGLPACGNRVWACRDDGRPARAGEEGELVVDGPTVMLGYWGREPQRGPYRTGDVVRVLDDGSFDYVGRSDHMVKVRGHRVEPGDVETALTAHPRVAEACAVVVGAGIDARLTAFTVPASPSGQANSADGAGSRRLDALELRRHCAERLPPYLIPDDIRVVDTLPRTANGKIDRLALASGVHPGPRD